MKVDDCDTAVWSKFSYRHSVESDSDLTSDANDSTALIEKEEEEGGEEEGEEKEQVVIEVRNVILW